MPLQERVGDGTGIFRPVTFTGHWSAADGPEALKELLMKVQALTKETFDWELNLKKLEKLANDVSDGHGLRFP